MSEMKSEMRLYPNYLSRELYCFVDEYEYDNERVAVNLGMDLYLQYLKAEFEKLGYDVAMSDDMNPPQMSEEERGLHFKVPGFWWWWNNRRPKWFGQRRFNTYRCPVWWEGKRRA